MPRKKVKPTDTAPSETETGANTAVATPSATPSEVPAESKPKAPKTMTTQKRSYKYIKRWPDIVCGSCEHCGTMIYERDDKGNDIGRIMSIRNCEHYKNTHVECFYCGETLPDTPFNPTEMRLKATYVLLTRRVQVFEPEDAPGQLLMICSDHRCQSAHNKRFSDKG